MPEMLPQHDLDAQRTLGRAWITDKGRDALTVGQVVESLGSQALESAEYQRGYSAGWKAAVAIFGSSAIKAGVARMWAYLGR